MLFIEPFPLSIVFASLEVFCGVFLFSTSLSCHRSAPRFLALRTCQTGLCCIYVLVKFLRPPMGSAVILCFFNLLMLLVSLYLITESSCLSTGP